MRFGQITENGIQKGLNAFVFERGSAHDGREGSSEDGTANRVSNVLRRRRLLHQEHLPELLVRVGDRLDHFLEGEDIRKWFKKRSDFGTIMNRMIQRIIV